MDYFEWNEKIFKYFFNESPYQIKIVTASRRILGEIIQEEEEIAFKDFTNAIKNGPSNPKRYHFDKEFNILQIAHWLKNAWRNKLLYHSIENKARLWIIDPNDPPPYLAYLFFLILEVRQKESSYWQGINKILNMPKLGSKDGTLLLELFEDLNIYDKNFYFQNIYPSGAWLYVGTLYSQIPITLEEEKLTIARLILGGIEQDQIIDSTGKINVSDEELISIFNSYSKPILRNGIKNLLSKDDIYREFVEDYFINEFRRFSWDISDHLLSEVKISEKQNEVKLGIKIIPDTFTGKKIFQLVAAYHDEKQHDQTIGEQLKVGKDILTIKSIKTSDSLIIGELTKKHIEDLKSKMLDVFFGLENTSLASFREKRNRVFYYHSSNFFLEEENFHNTNRNSFYLMTVDEKITEIEGSKLIDSFDYAGIKLFEFSPHLCEEQFSNVQLLLGVKGLGKISLIGEFLLDRRKKIVLGYPYYFEYTGPKGSPELFAITEEDQVKIKLEPLSDQDNRFVLPEKFPIDVDFRIVDNTQSLRSPIYCYSNLDNIDAGNLPRISKDKSGIHQERVSFFSDISNEFEEDISRLNSLNSEFNNLFRAEGYINYTSSGVYTPNTNGNKLLNFLAIREINWVDVKEKFNSIFPDYAEKSYSSSFFYLMEQWRDLGYLDFDSKNNRITIPPTTLLFTQSKDGIKAFLTGYRDENIINKLKDIKRLTGMPLKIKLQVVENQFLPQSIFIGGEYNHIKQAAEHLGIQWNKLDNVYHPDDYVYQLKCLLFQNSVDQFKDSYSSLPKFEIRGELRDDHKKEIFKVDSLKWEATTKKIIEFGNNSMLVRYKNSGGFSFWYVYRSGGESYVLPTYHLCLFNLLALENKSVLLRRKVDEEHYDLLVPFGPVKLPYWINKCLVLLNAELPTPEFIAKKPYSSYKGINQKFLDIINEKLQQEIKEIIT